MFTNYGRNHKIGGQIMVTEQEYAKLNDENAKLLAELITAKEEIKQLKVKLKNHEDRIMENARILQ